MMFVIPKSHILINRYRFFMEYLEFTRGECVPRDQTDRYAKIFLVSLEDEVQLPSFLGSPSQIKSWNCLCRDWAR